MEITPAGITFQSLFDLNTFVKQLDLYGSFKLDEAIRDKTGKILIRENVYVKDTTLKKLESLEGNYEPTFKLTISGESLKKLRGLISEKILEQLKVPEDVFIKYLFEHGNRSYKGFITQSFRSKRLALTAFKLSHEKPAFFHHLCEMGLLNLGIILQKNYTIPMIHRNAFIAGFCCDLGLIDTDKWQKPFNDELDRLRLAAGCAEIAARFHVPPEPVVAIRNHTLEPDSPGASPKSLNFSISESAIMEEMLGEDDGAEEFETNLESDEMSEMLLTESLRLTRFIDDTVKRIEDREHFAEELVYMVAYNAARGYFHKDLVNPLISRFREYEEQARKLMRLAELEAQCKYPPSAWAYPKPNATQILCKDHVDKCPLLMAGWDIQVVTPQDAFGWIGGNLRAGKYPKCRLEGELKNL